jgi:hypothetical protein
MERMRCRKVCAARSQRVGTRTQFAELWADTTTGLQDLTGCAIQRCRRQGALPPSGWLQGRAADVNTYLPSVKVAKRLKLATHALITLAIVSVAIAIVSPASHSPYLSGGLIALVLAFLCALWRIFFLKLPISGRGGAVLTIQTHLCAHTLMPVCTGGTEMTAAKRSLALYGRLSRPGTRANTKRFSREMFEPGYYVDVGHCVRGIGCCHLGKVGHSD